MDAIRTPLPDGDGLTVPLGLRPSLGLQPGDAMVVERRGDELRIGAGASNLRRVQDLLAPSGPTGGEPLVSDQSIADRRAEGGA